MAAQLVFVHGVNTRRERDPNAYDENVAVRSRRFAEVSFNDPAMTVANPYWGKYGAHPGWQLACIPKMGGQYVPLGGLGGLGGNEIELSESTVLIAAARTSFQAVVGALSAEDLVENPDDRERERFWLGAARYAETTAKPAWLAQTTNDEAFLNRLGQEARARQGQVALGGLDFLKDVGAKIVGSASNLVNGPLAKVGRDVMTPGIAIFIGDVFRYLQSGAGRDPIRQEVMDAIVTAAKAAKAAGAPLVLIGHSMGGVILYDMLSDPQALAQASAAIGAPLEVDLLLSVGSQVALFEELKVFAASDPAVLSPSKVARPACVARWWNAFDKMDVLSFCAEPVFDGVEDFAVDTIAGVKDAHGAYFDSMPFYERIGIRLFAAGLRA